MVKNINDLLPTEDQDFAKVTKVLGGGSYRLVNYCSSSRSSSRSEKIGISRGKLNRNVKIIVGTIVLVSIRNFQPNKLDILYVYTCDEINKLVSKGYISDKFVNSTNDEFDSNIEFDSSNVDWSDI